MTALNIETLKRICNKLPDAYQVKVETSNGDIIHLGDTIEIDISNGNLILKE